MKKTISSAQARIDPQMVVVSLDFGLRRIDKQCD